FDTHAPSVSVARAAAADAGLSARLRFDVVSASTFPGDGYDLITCLDTLHDLADPVAAARRIGEALAEDGTWLISEPAAGDRVEANLGTLGRLLTSTSVLHCIPVSLGQGGAGPGALGGEAWVRDIVRASGLTRFRRVTETGADCVFQARR